MSSKKLKYKIKKFVNTAEMKRMRVFSYLYGLYLSLYDSRIAGLLLFIDGIGSAIWAYLYWHQTWLDQKPRIGRAFIGFLFMLAQPISLISVLGI